MIALYLWVVLALSKVMLVARKLHLGELVNNPPLMAIWCEGVSA